jgi:uncharacterized membrane protein (DUF4010 family)
MQETASAFPPIEIATKLLLSLAIGLLVGFEREWSHKDLGVLGLIGFVIYPVLPNRFVDPWNLLNPREAWFTVILIASIGFLHYVLLRLYSARGLYYSAVFGGLVNSTATIAELSLSVSAAGPNARQLAIAINLLTIVSMFVRNLALLLIFSPQAGFIAAVPIGLMALSGAAFIWWNGRAPVDSAALAIGSPVSLRQFSFLRNDLRHHPSSRVFGSTAPRRIWRRHCQRPGRVGEQR